MPVVDEGYYGTKAIGLTAPTNSVANLGVALAELYREGLPHLVGMGLLHNKLLSIPAKLGEEFLNWEFGYKPLAADAASAMGLVGQVSKIANQYLRDNGRMVRRSYDFGTITTKSTWKSAGSNFIVLGQTYPYCFAGGPTGQITITEQSSYRVWFSGAYQLEFTRLVRRPGLKRSHSQASRDEIEGGQARVYSKALVEENKSIMSKAR
jgi:hypothetical protein